MGIAVPCIPVPHINYMETEMSTGNRRAFALSQVALVCLLAACGGGGGDGGTAGPGPGTPPAPAPEPRVAGMVYAAPTVVTEASGNQTVSVQVLAQNGVRTLTTGPIAADAATAVQTRLTRGNLVDWSAGSTADTVKVATDAPADTFNVILSKGSSAAAQFDMSKFGPEVSPTAPGVPGAMVAAGWVYNKQGNTITISDGSNVKADQAGRPYAVPIKRYEETFRVSPNVKVYNVNTANYAASAESDFDSIPVTADYHYSTTSRQAAYLVFDRNYRGANDAQVVGIWYFTPQSTSDGKPVWDVPTLSPMLADKGNDPISGNPFVSINATGVSAAPYTRSTEPFEMVKNTMYYVGDNEVSSYIFKADMGTPNDPSDDKIIKVDAGWPNSGYQYWRNTELLGIDPRSVTDLWLTHAHSDHYGTAVEQLKMMDNAGLNMNLWGSREDTIGITGDLQGNVWNIAGTLGAGQTVLRERTNNFYEYDRWYDYGNVQIMVIWSPGHTTGATNMLFRVKNPDNGQFVTFGYHGGYGFNGLERPTAANGFLRLAWQFGFSYLQNRLEVDFVAPQHANHFPIVEVYQALKAYNRDPANTTKLTMLDALRTKVFDSPEIAGNKITSEFANQLEKRRSVATYRATDDQPGSTRRSIETSGPFKPGRAGGLTDVGARVVGDPKIIQGFVSAQNKNPLIPLLATGMPTTLDPYTDDPIGFFVQVAVAVQDPTYQGFLPDGFTQFSPGMNATITYRGGPIESTQAERGVEYLRTQRVATLAEAQQIMASITRGNMYTISLTPASEIVVPVGNAAQTFRP